MNIHKTVANLFLVCALVLAQSMPFVGFVPVASAQTVGLPNTLGYQGRLKDSSGNTLTGSYKFRFKLYDASTAGNTLWTEEHNPVTVSTGNFSVQLGSVTAFAGSVDFTKNMWLGIEVATTSGSYEAMGSRVPVNSVAFAMAARGVENAASDPADTYGGRTYYNTATGQVKYYDAVATAWKTINTGSGSGVSSTIDSSDLDFVATSTYDFIVSVDGTGEFRVEDGTDALIQGTGDGKVRLNSDSGDGDAIQLNATSGGLDVNVNGTTAIDSGSTILRSTGAAADALFLESSGGGLDIDINGNGTIDAGGSLSLDSATNSNYTVTANDGTDQTLTVSASNAGAGDGNIALSADNIAVTGATTFNNDITVTGSTVLNSFTASEGIITTSSGSELLNVLVGNVKIGNGTPDGTLDGEDLYVEGFLEVDGATDLDSSLNVAGSAVFGAGINMSAGTMNLSGTAITSSVTGGTTFTSGGQVLLTSNVVNPSEAMVLSAPNGGISILPGSGNAAKVTGNFATSDGTISMLANDTSSISMEGSDATDRTFTLSADNSGAGNGVLALTATGSGSGDGIIDVGADVWNAAITNGLAFNADNASDVAMNFTTSNGGVRVNTDTNRMFNVRGGSLVVGDASSDGTLDGEDAYIEGFLEVDGLTDLDGNLDMDGTTFTLDSTETSSMILTANSASDQFIRLTATNAGAGQGQISIMPEDVLTGTSKQINLTGTNGGANDTAIAMVSSSSILAETPATQGLVVQTGNFRVGNATPDGTLDGEDAYIEGFLEVDGATDLDGSLAVAGSATFTNTVAATGATFSAITSGSQIFTASSGAISLTAGSGNNISATLGAGTDALTVAVGNLKIGDGTPDVTLDGEDAYIEGTLEVDGASSFDNGVTVAGDLVAENVFRLADSVEVLEADVPTPNVGSGSVFKTANTVATTISNFVSAQDGQLLTLIIGDSNTTISCTGANIECGSANIVTATNDTLTFVQDADVSKWYLLSYVDDSDVQDGADLAEYYPSDEPLTPGDVVVLDTNNEEHIALSTQAKDNLAVGVITTYPWNIMGTPGPDQYAMALTGRVPVKVTDENGPIKIGDALTSASKPGYAMKAEAGDPTLGLAIQDFDGSTGAVVMLISRNNAPTVTAASSSSSQTVAVGSVLEKATLIQPVFDQDTVGQAKIKGGQTEVRVTFKNEYQYQPIVNVTPIGVYQIDFGVTDIDTKGFTVKIGSGIVSDVTFNWTSLSSKDAKIFVSDGSVGDVEIILPGTKKVEEVPVVEEVAPSSSSSSESSEETPAEGEPAAEEGSSSSEEPAGDTSPETPVEGEASSAEPEEPAPAVEETPTEPVEEKTPSEPVSEESTPPPAEPVEEPAAAEEPAAPVEEPVVVDPVEESTPAQEPAAETPAE